MFLSRAAGVMCLFFALACSRAMAPPSVPPEDSSIKRGGHDASGTKWLSPYAERAAEAGAAALENLAFGSGAPGDTIDAFVFVDKSECALLFARGSEQIDDLDLHIFGDDGEEYGADEATDDEPGLLICPERSVRLYVSARVVQGQGLIALGLQRTSREGGARAASAIGAKGAYIQAADAEAWPGLVAALGRHREDIGGRWTDQRRVALPVDSRVPTTVSAVVPAGRCLDVLVLPGEEVSGMELTLQDPETGRLMGRGVAKGEQRTLVVCGHDIETSLQLSIRPRSGRGLAVLALSASERGESDKALRSEAGAILLERPPATDFRASNGTSGRGQVMELKVGELLTRLHTVQGCMRYQASPSKSLMGYTLRAWDEQGKLWAETRSRWQSSIWLCGEGRVRIEGEALRRGGSLQLVGQKHPVAAVSSLAHAPLAASRLLEELERKGVKPTSLEHDNVHRVLLRHTQLWEQVKEVKAGQCLTTFLAGDLEGFGVELRILDLDSHQELALARGARAVHASTCADAGETLRLRVEATTLRGQGEALIALLLEAPSSQ